MTGEVELKHERAKIEFQKPIRHRRISHRSFEVLRGMKRLWRRGLDQMGARCFVWELRTKSCDTLAGDFEQVQINIPLSL